MSKILMLKTRTAEYYANPSPYIDRYLNHAVQKPIFTLKNSISANNF